MFTPWLEHQPERGRCQRCGMEIPHGAVHDDGLAFSHVAVGFYRGDPPFSLRPIGRTILCQPLTPPA